MRYFTAALVLSVLGATPALAQETSDRPFEGATATAIAGVDLNVQFGSAQAGVLYGGQLGYDWQRGGTVFGIEGEVTGASTRDCSDNVVAPARYCDKAGRDLYVGGRLGQVIGDSTLLYLKAGYTNYRDNIDYVDGGTGANSYSGSGVLSGVRGGVGIEQAIGKNLLIKAEYRYSHY